MHWNPLELIKMMYYPALHFKGQEGQGEQGGRGARGATEAGVWACIGIH